MWRSIGRGKPRVAVGNQVGKTTQSPGFVDVEGRYRTSSWGLWKPKRTTLQLTPCLMLALRFHHGLRGWHMLTILLTGERGFCYHVANQIHVARHFHDWQPPRIQHVLGHMEGLPKAAVFQRLLFLDARSLKVLSCRCCRWTAMLATVDRVILATLAMAAVWSYGYPYSRGSQPHIYIYIYNSQ